MSRKCQALANETRQAMTELLLRLRSSEPAVREQMLQEESEKGLHKFRLLGRAAGF